MCVCVCVPFILQAVRPAKPAGPALLSCRVMNVLRHWVESHYHDFERDPELLDKLVAFVDSISSKSMQKWIASIHRALAKVSWSGPSCA